MRYDRGYGGMGGYDYGLRGYRQTAGPRGGYGRGGYGGDYRNASPFPNRVTARYNLDYVRPGPDRHPVNYAPFGGDARGRNVDATGYWRPYLTNGGTRTWRGGDLPVGWESRYRYDRGFRGYGGDFYGPLR